MLDIAPFLLLGAAGTALYFLVRVALGGDRWMRTLVLVGFLGRAFLSQLLFWISCLSLPVAPGLHMERGLWFFAVDSRLYLREANQAVAGGLDNILRLTASSPSASYVQALSFFSFLLGDPIAVSLLLNLFCYAGACAIITRWSATSPGSRNAARIAIAAISLSPAGVLWSMQPLKDTFFQFLIIAFFGACFLWQRAWRMNDLGGQVWWGGGAIVSVHYLISGVRWYVGFMMLAVAVLILPVIALTLHRRRLIASVAALAMLVVLSRSLLIAGGPHIPLSVRDLLHLRSPVSGGAVPLVAQVEEVRSGFDRLGGNTTIRPVANPKRPPDASANVASGNAVSPDKAPEARSRAMGPRPAPAGNPAGDEPTPAPSHVSPSTTSTSGITGAQPPVTASSSEPPRPAKPATAAPTQPTRPPNAAQAETGPVESTKPRATAPAPTVAQTEAKPLSQPQPVPVTGEPTKAPANAPALRPQPAPVNTANAKNIDRETAATPPTVAPQVASQSPSGAQNVVPEVQKVATKSSSRNLQQQPTASHAEASTRAQKLLAGAAAAALPRTISDRLGLVHIGEGRGFWWFTELDTIFFDTFLLLSLVSIVLGFRRASPQNGVFWLILGVTILMAIGLAYAVTNFGTMFRHRVMVLTSLSLIPLALATAPSREAIAPLESKGSKAPALESA